MSVIRITFYKYSCKYILTLKNYKTVGIIFLGVNEITICLI